MAATVDAAFSKVSSNAAAKFSPSSLFSVSFFLSIATSCDDVFCDFDCSPTIFGDDLERRPVPIVDDNDGVGGSGGGVGGGLAGWTVATLAAAPGDVTGCEGRKNDGGCGD
jgi:hypothetical protein